MTVDEMIEVLQGSKEGKKTQLKNKDKSSEWHDYTRNSLLWNFEKYDYRIKPVLPIEIVE